MTFWQACIGVIVKPLSTLQRLEDDKKAGLKGLGALLLVLGIYTVILGIFIMRGYPAAAPSVLPVAVEQQYQFQIWYQGPLFLISTLLLTWLLMWMSRARGQAGTFGTSFARVSFSTTIPFALTTMLVELVIALLVLGRAIQPHEALAWLVGDGLWFATTYQLAGILWLVGLLIVTAKISVSVRWGVGVLLGILLAAVYAVPIALFIR